MTAKNYYFPHRDDPGNYPEDFPHENGNYVHTCYVCKAPFLGHKRQVSCKTCSTATLTPTPQEHPMTEPKTLHNSTVSGARQNVKDIKVVGNGDAFQLLCKASSETEGWMKSTKAMQIDGMGCLIQVTTQQRNPDGSYAVAEALTFVHDIKIVPDENGGRKLVVDGTPI